MFELTTFDILKDKVARDGKVAVLVSPGFGAGWYSWNTKFPKILFDIYVVSWVLNGKKGPIPELSDRYGDYVYDGGINKLKVEWVTEGTLFRINEYDGSESLIRMTEDNWHTA
jgi:hypothetical protein